MSGVVAACSLVVVIELGAPVASNLGAGLPSAPHDKIVSQALGSPNAPTWGPGATSMASTIAAVPVDPAPTTIQTAGYDPSVVTPAVSPPATAAQPATATAGAPASSDVVSPAVVTTTRSPGAGDGGADTNLAADPQATVAQEVQSDWQNQGEQQNAGDHQNPGDQQGGGDQQGLDNGQGNGQGNAQGNGHQHSQGEYGQCDHGHVGGSD